MQIHTLQRLRPVLSHALARQIAFSQLRSLVESRGGAEEARWRLPTGNVSYESAISLLNQYQTNQFRRNPARPKTSAKERTKNWLNLLGCEVDRLEIPRVIHIAGSKGKGTTCSYCNHILITHQRITGKPKKIGCYTSPHQMDVRERILINNEKIPKPLFSHYVWKLDSKIRSLTSQQELESPSVPGYPGFLALLAIYIFISEKVDVVVLETGIGGERDSTNIFPRPAATGITTIGLDHTNVLGNTVEQIAWHKAGIFKHGSPAFAIVQDEAVLKVLRSRAVEKQIAGELQIVTDQKALEYNVRVSPNMHYQKLNASLAISLAESYLKSEDPEFSMTGDVARGLQEAELPGRCTVTSDKDNTWFVSVAHNVVSLVETVAWFKGIIQAAERAFAPRVLIFNQMFNKSSPRDPYTLLKAIHEGLREDSPVTLQGVIFCTDQSDETGKEKSDLIDLRMSKTVISSLNSQRDNARIWKGLGGSGEVVVVHTIREAIGLVRKNYKGADVLVTGSSFLAGGVLHALR